MEALAPDLREMRRIPLAPEHVAALTARGQRRHYPAGMMIAEPGQPIDRFIYVEAGEVEVVDPYTGERHLPSTLGPTQFMGEIAFLTGGVWSLAMRACGDTDVIEVPRDAMLALMASVPEMSDIIITVLAARRRRQLDDRSTALTLIGEAENRAVQAVATFASRNRIPYRSLPLNSADAADAIGGCPLGPGQPGVIFGRETVLTEPTVQGVARMLGLDLDAPDDARFDVLIVGGGPAGVAAAVYAGAEGLKALLVEDLAVGGQAGTSSRIENYMGFPTGISGADLVWRGEIQAMKFGTRFAMPCRVASLEQEGDDFCATLEDGRRIRARAVVVAAGVQYRRLPLDRLREFEGAGVYYAATELEARQCRDGEAVIIGGGNSAGQAAMFLSRHARRVRLVVRGPSLAASMSSYLSERIASHPGITVEYGSEVSALSGNDHLRSVTIRRRDTGETRKVASRALFIMAGAAPNTGWLASLVALDGHGFIVTGEGGSPYATSRPGIYAVGDIRAGSVKRVAAAVGEGSVVISHVWAHVNGR